MLGPFNATKEETDRNCSADNVGDNVGLWVKE